jgi:hypothetical protein
MITQNTYTLQRGPIAGVTYEVSHVCFLYTKRTLAASVASAFVGRSSASAAKTTARDFDPNRAEFAVLVCDDRRHVRAGQQPRE